MKYLSALLINLAFAANAFAMAGQPGGGEKGGGSMVSLILPMVVIFGIFYLMLIRPQQKQQKKFKEMLSQLQKGDEVVTRGGILGRVHGIADNIVTLEIADNVKVRLGKEYIAIVKGKENPVKS